jgi:hypothetical protein
LLAECQFRVRSYEKAAKAVTRVPGVGKSVAAKIAEYRRTGTIKAVDDLRAKLPLGALLLAKVPGVGPRRALRIAGDLGVTSVDELAEAVRGGRLRGVAGFGPKIEERILRGIGVAVSDAALRDAGPAGPAPRARGHRRHGPAARDGAQHRPGRERGLGRGLPERVRPVRGLGSDRNPDYQTYEPAG